MSIKKILFISHDASKTGAPLVLLNLIKWLKSFSNIEIHTLLLQGGEYLDDFGIYSHKLFTDYRSSSLFSRYWRAFRRRLLPKINELNNGEYDIVYANTVVSVKRGYEIALKNDARFIVHLHEHDFSIECFYPLWNFGLDMDKINKVIAVSDFSRRLYENKYGIAPEKIEVINEFIEVDKIIKPTKPKFIVKEELGLKKEFVVGMCGSGTWRKGIDLFFELSYRLYKLDPNKKIVLVWIGEVSKSIREQFLYEVKLIGGLKIIFTGLVVDPENHLQILDVFTLTSREDPFPLVALEAAALSLPIVYFDHSGGIAEFLGTEAGIKVDYADVTQMSKAVLRMFEFQTERKSIGLKAFEKVKNYDVGVLAPKLFNEMCRVQYSKK